MKAAVEPAADGTIRAFVALDLEGASLRRIARIADRLRMATGAPSATWTPSSKMHVTLKFIAGLPANEAAPLGQMLGELVRGMRAPRAGAMRLEAFPSVKVARVIVLELEDPEGLLGRVANEVEAIALECGIAREVRPFRPHVTLARLKMAYDARRWMRAEIAEGTGECRVVQLSLYRSDLGAEGSTYVPLAKFDFLADE